MDNTLLNTTQKAWSRKINWWEKWKAFDFKREIEYKCMFRIEKIQNFIWKNIYNSIRGLKLPFTKNNVYRIFSKEDI